MSEDIHESHHHGYTNSNNQSAKAAAGGDIEAPSFPGDQGLISDEVLHIFNIVNYVVLSVTVSTCGIVTNSLNIRVFLRQGFKDTINISFFGLAVSDLLVQIVTLLLSVCMNPWFTAINSVAFMSGWVQVITTRITAWITAFLTFERCLCIVMPLKVKAIVTSRRTTTVIVSIFVAATFCVIPIYFTFELGTVLQPSTNASLLVLVFLEDRLHILDTMIYLNNVVSPLTSFTIVFICTVVLVININRTARWRLKFSSSSSASSTKDDSAAATTSHQSRDSKVIKMVTACAAIYIICFTPPIVIFVWSDISPDFSLTGRDRNLYLLLNTFSLLTQSINSSVNILVYYNMSSKYRATFRSLFITRNKEIS